MPTNDTAILAKVATHNLNRRSFLRGALGTAVAASGLALAACGGSSDDAAPAADASGETEETGEPAAAPGDPANVIRYGVAKPDASFDTQTTSSTIGISENVTEGLYELDTETNEVKPVLAAALPTISDNGLTYEIELKEGVKFHDGSTLTADDVKFTFTRLVAINAEADSFSKIVGFDALAAGETDELEGLTAQADYQLTHVDYGTIPVDWPQSPYALKPEFSGIEVLVDFHFKNVVKSA